MAARATSVFRRQTERLARSVSQRFTGLTFAPGTKKDRGERDEEVENDFNGFHMYTVFIGLMDNSEQDWQEQRQDRQRQDWQQQEQRQNWQDRQQPEQAAA